ncbi:hypothetical protein ABIE69_002397 [Rhodobacteraceae bacterium MBR-64]|jgi:hypothetical protein
MALIADFLMVAGAIAAAAYCMVLSRRLKRFTRLEDGVGGAIAVLSAQVDDMTQALKQARNAAQNSEATLIAQTARAENAARRLSLMLASLHDLPDPPAAAVPVSAPVSAPSPAQPPVSGDPAPAAASDDASLQEPDRRVRFLRRRPALVIPEAAE